MYKTMQLILSIFLAFTLISCGGSSDDSAIAKGVVYDDVVVGLDYQTKDFSGKTNDKGEFNYKEGDVKFYLKNLYIGKIPTMPKDNKVFLSDILNTKRGDYRSKEVVKLARLLQSLDTTSPNDEKITLNQEKIEELFSSNQTLDKLDLTKLNLAIVPKEEAKNRVRDTLVREGIAPIDNIKPTAKAGENQTAQEGENITLDGSKSTDTDGTIVKYEWFDKNNNSLSKEKTYTTNSLSVGEHTITLKVTDDEGAVGSQSVTITITAKPTPPLSNQPPTANAGADQTKQEGQSITLDGSSSTDPDGSIVKYEWFDANNNSLHVGASFTKNDFAVGTHTITLKVTDDKGASANDSVVITITAIPAPTATITPADQTTNVALDSNITIVFSQEMNGSSLTASNIALTKSGTPTALNYTIATNDNNKTLKLKPSNVFDFNTNYTLTIQNVTSKGGKPISPTTATFETSNLNLSILKTGQTTSYVPNDDGAYGKGVARNYSKIDINSTASIVKDNVTGLEWQNEYSADMNWTKANEYCTNLTLNGTSDWRLPSILEISTLTDFGKQNPALDAKFNFLFTSNELYHSATSLPIYNTYERTFRPGLGQISYHLKKNEKKVMCVRGEQIPSLKCYRKDESKTIICSNGLMWQDDESAKINKKNWSQAIEHCENLDFANYSDWRLPNINELKSIVDYHKLPSFSSSFKNISTGNSDIYWSSTNSVFGTDINAWYVRFSLGEFHVEKKSSENFVRCVR